VTDFDDDARLAVAFAELRSEVAPYVRPAGTAAVRETVRRCRRARTFGATALALLAVAGPVAVFAAVHGDPHGPPAVSGSQSPDPEPSESSESAPSSQGLATPTAPDGRITRTTLDEATLDLPAWPAPAKSCVTGPVKFTHGSYEIMASVSVWIEKVVYVDIDHDGAKETVARLTCGDQVGIGQVVAFDRDAAGAIRTLGQVVTQTGDIEAICDIREGSGGAVDVRVADVTIPLRCIDLIPSFARFQWRGYAWNGTRMAQTDGPTAFGLNPKVTDFTATATDLVFAAAVDGLRHGSMQVTVRNLGPKALPFEVGVSLPLGLQLVTPGWSTKVWPSSQYLSCDQDKLAVGATRTLTIEFTATGPVTPSGIPTASGSVKEGYGDPDYQNDSVQFAVRF
jgi:hypothetical protein